MSVDETAPERLLDAHGDPGLFIGGRWRRRERKIDVRNSFAGEKVGEISRGTPEDVRASVEAASVSARKRLAHAPALRCADARGRSRRRASGRVRTGHRARGQQDDSGSETRTEAFGDDSAPGRRGGKEVARRDLAVRHPSGIPRIVSDTTCGSGRRDRCHLAIQRPPGRLCA